MTTKTHPADANTLLRLDKREIDRRIESLASTIAATGSGAATPAGDPLLPRWIAATELVRRMRPFLVYN